MAVIEGGVSGLLAEVGLGAAMAQHATIKPIPHGSLGHYRSAVRFATVAAQATIVPVWEVRNTAANIIIPTRLRVSWTQAGIVTTAGRYDLELRRLTGFTVSSTTNTVTPTASIKRTSGMAAPPGGAAIRHVTIAGAAAGMTGGTWVADGGAGWIGERWFLAAMPTASELAPVVPWELLDDVNGTHPFALAQNEGLQIRPIVAGSVTSFITSISVDFSWAEVTAF